MKSLLKNLARKCSSCTNMSGVTIRYASGKEQSQPKLISLPPSFAIQETAKILRTRYTEPIHCSQGSTWIFLCLSLRHTELGNTETGSRPSALASPWHSSTHVLLPAPGEPCTSVTEDFSATVMLSPNQSY